MEGNVAAVEAFQWCNRKQNEDAVATSFSNKLQSIRSNTLHCASIVWAMKKKRYFSI